MQIKDLGGEFALIDKITRLSPIHHQDLEKGIGDDTAVIRSGDGAYVLVTTDMLVENDHFRIDWSQPDQIGIKAVECNVSDIAAMGGTPTFMFVSLALPGETDTKWVESLYKGMATSCEKHGVVIAGGDTTKGGLVTISITLMGITDGKRLCLRSHAEPGDLLAVTGLLGGSAACLSMLDKGHKPTEYLMQKHLTPTCRLDASKKIAPHAKAMIDISDGLASEVNHICAQSGTGAVVFEDKIPVHDDVAAAGKTAGKPPSLFALDGGEDFELLFTFDPSKQKDLDRTGVDYVVVGKITEREKGCNILLQSGETRPLQGGFNHFSMSAPRE